MYYFWVVQSFLKVVSLNESIRDELNTRSHFLLASLNFFNKTYKSWMNNKHTNISI